MEQELNFEEVKDVAEEVKDVSETVEETKETFGQRFKKHLPKKETVISVGKKIGIGAAIAAVAVYGYIKIRSGNGDADDICLIDDPEQKADILNAMAEATEELAKNPETVEVGTV